MSRHESLSLAIRTAPRQVITDLNNPDRVEVVRVGVDPESGEHVVGASAVEVASAGDCLRAFRTGVSRIGSYATKLGPSEHRSSSCFTLRRATKTHPPSWSTLRIVHLAGTEALCEDSTHVEMLGGLDINRGVSAFASIVDALAGDPHNASAAPYTASKVTALLRSALGGNCQTHALVHMSSSAPRGGDMAACTARILQLCAGLGRITNYPVLGSVAARGLEAHYRRLVAAAAATAAAESKAAAGAATSDGSGGGIAL